MKTYFHNSGFNETTINDNGRKNHNLIEWDGDYDGKHANIKLKIKENDKKETMILKLDNNDIIQLLGVQATEMPLERRLMADFLNDDPIYEPIMLEGVLKPRRTIQHKSHKRHKRHRIHNKKHKTRKSRKYKI